MPILFASEASNYKIAHPAHKFNKTSFINKNVCCGIDLILIDGCLHKFMCWVKVLLPKLLRLRLVISDKDL